MGRHDAPVALCQHRSNAQRCTAAIPASARCSLVSNPGSPRWGTASAHVVGLLIRLFLCLAAVQAAAQTMSKRFGPDVTELPVPSYSVWVAIGGQPLAAVLPGASPIVSGGAGAR
jgi:hypothetical protein